KTRSVMHGRPATAKSCLTRQTASRSNTASLAEDYFVLEGANIMSLSPGGTPLSAPTSSTAMDPRIPVIQRMQRGAGWFLTIGILSGVNALLQFFEAKIRFIFVLGITQVVDAVARSEERRVGAEC